MATYVTPKINTAYECYVSLVSQANTKLLQVSPTMAAGDVKVSTDNGASANITTLPVIGTNTRVLKVNLSAAEMNGGNVAVIFSDAAGAEWCDLTLNIQTSARQIDDLASPTNITAGTITTVTTLTGHTPQTGDTFALANGANGFVATKADTAAILIDTAEIGIAGAGLTNINLPNQIMDITGNITGNLSGSVGSVTAAVAITSNIKQNQALAGFTFLLTDSTTHAPSAGLGATPVATRSINGGAFAAGTLSAVAEVASGLYTIDWGAGDLNGKVVTLRVTCAATDTLFERIVTQV